MAGYELDDTVPIPPVSDYIDYATNEHYGFMHFKVFNNTHAYTKFIDSGNGETIDQVWVINPYIGKEKDVLLL